MLVRGQTPGRHCKKERDNHTKTGQNTTCDFWQGVMDCVRVRQGSVSEVNPVNQVDAVYTHIQVTCWSGKVRGRVRFIEKGLVLRASLFTPRHAR